MAKRIELLRQIVPSAKRIGFLGDPTEPTSTLDRNALAPVALTLGLTIVVGEASSADEFDAAAAKLMGSHVDAIHATST